MSTTITNNNDQLNNLNNKEDMNMTNQTINTNTNSLNIKGGNIMSNGFYVQVNNEGGKLSFNSANTVCRVKTQLAKKDTYRLIKHTVTYDKKEDILKGVKDVLLTGENCYLREATTRSITLKLSDGSTRSIGKDKNFTDEYFMLEAHRNLLNNLRYNKLYMVPKTGKLIYAILGKKVEYLDLNTGKKINELPKTAIEYKFFMYGSGTIKKQRSIWCKASVNTIELQNKHTANMWKCVENLDRKSANKLATRPALGWSGNVLLGDDVTVAFFNGLFDSAENTSDGVAFVDALYIKELLGLPTEDEAIKIILQARFLGIVKFQLLTVPHILFKEMLNDRINECEIVGNNETVVICDKNCKKADFIGKGLNGLKLSLMAIGKVSEGNFSMQLINKMLVAAAEKGADELKKLQDDLVELFLNKIVDKFNRVDKIKEIGINQEYILDVLGCTNPLNPAVAGKKYDDLLNTFMNMIHKLAFPLDGYNMVVAGDVAAVFGIRIIAEHECLAGKFSKLRSNKIGADCILIKYPSMGIKEILTCTVLGVEEACKRVNAALYEGKINADVALGLRKYYRNMADATIMLGAYSNIFKTLAGMDTDFDKILVIFEEIVVDTLRARDEFIELSTDGAKEVEDIINNGQDKGSKGKLTTMIRKTERKDISMDDVLELKSRFTVDEKFLHEIYIIASKYEGMIGIITHYNDKVIAMLIEALAGNLVPAKRYFKELFGKEGVGEYKSEYNGLVTPMFAVNIVNKMRNARWTKDNIIAFLIDAIRVYRLYQESTIDAAKTGVYLTILLTVKSIDIVSLTKLYIKDGQICRELPKASKVAIKDALTGEERTVEKYLFTDAIAVIQNILIEELNTQYEDLVNSKKSQFRYTDKEMKSYEDTIRRLNFSEGGRALRDVLYLMKAVYMATTNKYIESRKNNNADDEAKVESARLSYLATCKSIGNSFLGKLDRTNLSHEDKINCLLGCSIMDKRAENINPESRNRMAYNILPGNTFAAITGSNKYEGICDVIQGGKFADGMEIEFKNGFSLVGGNTIVLSEGYTGVAKVIGITTIVDGEYRTTYKATATREVKLEKYDSNYATMVIEYNDDLDITADTILFFDKDGSIFLEKDCTVEEDDDDNYIYLGKAPIFFDGRKGNEYYINTVSKAELLDSIFKKEFVKNSRSNCLVISLEKVED